MFEHKMFVPPKNDFVYVNKNFYRPNRMSISITSLNIVLFCVYFCERFKIKTKDMSGFYRRSVVYRKIRINERNLLTVRRRNLRPSTDPFGLSNKQFRKLFRLPKGICRNFIKEVSSFMEDGDRNTRLPKKSRILVALRFFAQGSYQQSLGQNSVLNVSQPTVSRCVRELSHIMDRHLLVKYVRFPRNDAECFKVNRQFYEKFRFPGVIGVIDGCHIKIKRPGTEKEHVYVCQKGGHSINVQAVCDVDLKILDCNARFGGTADDASVWRASALRVFLQNKYFYGDRNFWLIGDSGYPQLNYLMTPIQGVNLTDGEKNYNRQHRKARNCIKRCFGVLKSRFRCLSRERVLCYNPVAAGQIINSCIILHNLLIEGKVTDDTLDEYCSDTSDETSQNSEYEDEDGDEDEDEAEATTQRRGEDNGFQTRNFLVSQVFI